MAKTVARKPLKNAAGSKGKAAAKKPVRDTVKDTVKVTAKEKAKTPVKKSQRNEEKPAAKKAGGKVAVREEKIPAESPVKKPARKEKELPAERTIKPPAPEEDNDSDADPVDEGLRLIQAKPEGILQSELWKELGVDSRKCSRIVKRLEESGLIERVDFKREGIKTYLLRAKQQPVNPADLLAGDELIPCIGCELECVVEECHPLMDWMYQLAIVQHSDE